MIALTLLWYAGPHDEAGWHGGWHPGFFMCWPGMFWLGLLCIFAVLWLSRRDSTPPGGQWRQVQQRQHPATPPAPIPRESSSSETAWPDLDPPPADQPRQQEQDIEYF